MGLLDEVIGAALGSKTRQRPILPYRDGADGAARVSHGARVGGTTRLARRPGWALEQFRQNGFEQAINSWIGTGPNHAISPTSCVRPSARMRSTIWPRQTGLPHDDLLSQLFQDSAGRG